MTKEEIYEYTKKEYEKQIKFLEESVLDGVRKLKKEEYIIANNAVDLMFTDEFWFSDIKNGDIKRNIKYKIEKMVSMILFHVALNLKRGNKMICYKTHDLEMKESLYEVDYKFDFLMKIMFEDKE